MTSFQQRLLVLITVIFFLVFGLYCRNLVSLFLSGLLAGIYFGLNDYRIFHYYYSDKFYKDNPHMLSHNKDLPKETFSLKVPELNESSKFDLIWVHVICGITSAYAVYLLLTNPLIDQYGISRIFLFLIALLGYSGRLPRTLWFLANKGGIGDIKN